MDALLTAFFYGAPFIGFGAGFLVGKLRRRPLRLVAGTIASVSPLAAILVPLFLASTPEERFAPGFALVLFAIPIALWMIGVIVGVCVSAARDGGPR